MDIDNPEEISDKLVCTAVSVKKRNGHLQIAINGYISHNKKTHQKQAEIVKAR